MHPDPARRPTAMDLIKDPLLRTAKEKDVDRLRTEHQRLEQKTDEQDKQIFHLEQLLQKYESRAQEVKDEHKTLQQLIGALLSKTGQ